MTPSMPENFPKSKLVSSLTHLIVKCHSLRNSIDSDFSWLTAKQFNDQQHLQLAIDFGH